MMKKLEVSWNIVFRVNLPAFPLPPPAFKLSRLLFNKQSGGEAYKRVESCRGSLFLFARQVRFFERHGPQNQTPRAGGWVKTNYGGVKRQAQWGTEKTATFSAPLDLSSAGQQWELVGLNNAVYTLIWRSLLPNELHGNKWNRMRRLRRLRSGMRM